MRFHFWYVAFSLFFTVLLVSGYLWLASSGRLTEHIPLGDYILMTLATMRLVRLFTYDIITAFIRHWFVGKDPDSFLGTLGALIGCPWCSGLWFAFMVIFFYFATPVAWYLILVLALAWAASFFQILANLVGWSAEFKKKEAQSLSDQS